MCGQVTLLPSKLLSTRICTSFCSGIPLLSSLCSCGRSPSSPCHLGCGWPSDGGRPEHTTGCKCILPLPAQEGGSCIAVARVTGSARLCSVVCPVISEATELRARVLPYLLGLVCAHLDQIPHELRTGGGRYSLSVSSCPHLRVVEAASWAALHDPDDRLAIGERRGPCCSEH